MRCALLLVAALGLLAAAPAGAQAGGTVTPRIETAVAGDGLVPVVSVRLTEAGGGEPIAGARVTVRARMTEPHRMRLFPVVLPARGGGEYRGPVELAMEGRWTLAIAATGDGIARARAEVPLRVRLGGGGPTVSEQLDGAAAGADGSLSERDAVTVAMLWLHVLAACLWIAGVPLLVVAVAGRPRLLAEPARARVAAAYRAWGAWAHWACIPVVVATGISLTARVTPFDLAWRPGSFDGLADVPYGPDYEAVLFLKLGLFAAMLVTGTQLLRRTLASPVDGGAAADGAGVGAALRAALGPAGVFYLACVPLIAAAAMALSHLGTLGTRAAG